ncbi:NAD(P)-dependent oxidoreductase [Candidatus Nitronereus thalassa]|uniref:NAD(P)-dependent oxidoreductase n=1 Tax=Candidatus Nitronereus thalassa TaxID=3020898 RepID=A0ABU3K5F3_9BACT|nr:NAD(P)-dependent oxidoreductase [Candidatus Nitronereus thalassa]MDT7041573.1 NAD(P)-dependent oxidoreductase [Candidatus Nitronereus thalassa]
MTNVGTHQSFRILNIEPEGYAARAQKIIQSEAELELIQLNRSDLLRVLPNFHGLIIRLKHQIDREVINAGKQLQVIVSATTGLDHIDVKYAEEKGITILSLQGEREFLRSVTATAELSWGLLIGLLRNMVPATNSVKSGVWNRDVFKGHDLRDRRIGILGLGRIGSMVASYAQVFGMNVVAYDPHPAEWVEGVRRVHDLNSFLQESDVLMVHVPLNQETCGMIGSQELACMPAGSFIVNTSRGEIIQEDALIEALKSRHLAGAALDVIAEERREQVGRGRPLMAYARNNNNLLITPHIGGATFESMAKTEIFMAKKLTHFIHTQRQSSKGFSFVLERKVS